MEDQEMIRRLEKRDETILFYLREKYENYCRKIAGNFLPDREDVEEILNDTWMNCWMSIPPAHPDSLKFYLARITQNLSMKRLRYFYAKKRKIPETALLEELEESIFSVSSPAEQLDYEELKRILNQFLERLPRKKRVMFLLRYWYGLKIKEIAEEMGYSESNVKNTLYETRNRLRGHLKREGYLQ